MAQYGGSGSVHLHGSTASSLLRRWQQQPVAWGREILNVTFTRQQTEALTQFVDNQKPNGGTGKMLIKSGYGTGKTWLAAFIGLWFVCCFPNALVLIMSSSGIHVRDKLFAEFRRLYLRSRVRLGGELLSMSLRFEEKWGATAVSPANPDNFQGSHEENLLVLFDEAQAVEYVFWDAADGMMQGANAATLGIFNPFYTEGRAAENWRKPNEWARCTFSALEHENVVSGRQIFPGAVSREWVEQRRVAWGESSALWRTRVLGEFPLTSDNALLSIFDLESAVTATTLRLQDGIWLGVDIARMGGDRSSASVVENGVLIHQRAWSFCDLMETCGRITELVREYEVPWEQVNLDVCGLGAGVYDRLVELEHAVNGVDFGAGVSLDWSELPGMSGLTFVNRRAELHWACRELVRTKRIVIPPRFTEAWADLVAVRYKVKSKGEILIESKDDFRKRMNRSPDVGDSVVYACSRMRSPSVTWSMNADERARVAEEEERERLAAFDPNEVEDADA